MGDEIREQNRATIRHFLNASKVKLWLKPYSNPDGSKDDSLEPLAKDINARLSIPQSLAVEILEDLRVHSCIKFNATKKFREYGIATLNLIVVSSVQAKNNIIPRDQNELTEVRLGELGGTLKKQVSERLGIGPHNLKFICSGRNIEDDFTLEQQNVNNLDSIMVLCLTNEERANFQETEHESLIGRAKKAAQLIANKNFFNLELEDQNGEMINIPEEEKKVNVNRPLVNNNLFVMQSLSIAMMLHEKGRAALKKKNFSLALIYLLESDSEFTKCNSSLLEVADNFALINLDIIWCYYCLQQVSSLHDAEKRLSLCEEKLRKSYGANMERVAKLRGGPGNELAIMVRLHLMQSAVFFYKGMYTESLKMLDKTEKELAAIQVDEKAMVQVMEMGFSEREARLSLRLCKGDVVKAVEHIMAEKQNRKRIRKEKMQKMRKTADGQQLDDNLLEYLASMGFNKNAAAKALMTNNNDLSKTLEALESPPHDKFPDQMVMGQLVSLGFSEEFITQAIQQSQSPEDIMTMIEDKMGGTSSTTEQSLLSILRRLFNNNNKPSGGTVQLNKEEEDLVNDEIQDINWSRDDYLDYLLDEESSILQDFKAKLLSLGYGKH